MTAPAPKPTPVIRQVRGAEEHHRALRKHVPAWVISGAVHVALIASLILADKLMGQVGANGKSDVSLTATSGAFRSAPAFRASAARTSSAAAAMPRLAANSQHATAVRPNPKPPSAAD